MVHLRGQQQIARREPLAGAEQDVACIEIDAARPDEVLGVELADAHLVARRLDILLDDDIVGPGRNRRSGEDADGFARPDLAVKSVAGGRSADQSEGGGQGGDIGLAHRIAIHHRGPEGRLGQLGRDIDGSTRSCA